MNNMNVFDLEMQKIFNGLKALNNSKDLNNLNDLNIKNS